MRILLVEDHQDSVESLAKYLALRGHTVVTARTADDAENLCNAEAFDLMICDIVLPGRDGWELGEVARRRNIVAIALTALGMPADRHRSETAGFVAHLVKPIDLGHLEYVIAEAFQIHQDGAARR